MPAPDGRPPAPDGRPPEAADLPFPEAADLADLPFPEAVDLAVASLALARRLAAGATLWCWSPAWPHHAEHVAVEFVHPVIVGKRALPAEAITGAHPVATLRALVQPGDVLLIVAGATEPQVADLLRRAPAWGARTIWIGAGARPTEATADHLLWINDDGSAAHRGDLVRIYHVLWELTHVCFEHPGLLDEPTGTACVTCADEGRVAEVVAQSGPDLALVRTASGPEEVLTALVGPIRSGDLVLVHAGTAIERIEEPQAAGAP